MAIGIFHPTELRVAEPRENPRPPEPTIGTLEFPGKNQRIHSISTITIYNWWCWNEFKIIDFLYCILFPALFLDCKLWIGHILNPAGVRWTCDFFPKVDRRTKVHQPIRKKILGWSCSLVFPPVFLVKFPFRLIKISSFAGDMGDISHSFSHLIAPSFGTGAAKASSFLRLGRPPGFFELRATSLQRLTGVSWKRCAKDSRGRSWNWLLSPSGYFGKVNQKGTIWFVGKLSHQNLPEMEISPFSSFSPFSPFSNHICPSCALILSTKSALPVWSWSRWPVGKPQGHSPMIEGTVVSRGIHHGSWENLVSNGSMWRIDYQGAASFHS